MPNLPIEKCVNCEAWDGEKCENENSPHYDKIVVANHGCHKAVIEED